MCKRWAGFTLAELLIVMVIVGIVALAAMPALSSSDDNKLELAASEVAAALRFARSEALRTGVYYGVRVTSDGRHVRVFRLDTGAVPPAEQFDVRHPMDKTLYDIDLTEGFFTSGVQASAGFLFYAGGSAEQAVSFDPRGDPVASSDLDALVSGAVTLSQSGDTRTVTVSPVGRVTVQ
jgi:type II secretion system protein H